MTTTVTDAASLERQRSLYDFMQIAVRERQRNVQTYSPPAHVENTTEAACWLMRLSDWWGVQPSDALLDWGSRLVRLRAACWRGWFGRG